jgi:hypothetical protein
MSQTKPVFGNGNKSISAALNRLADAMWKHGVNPGGRPGWVETKDGWMPPLALSQPVTESRWDLVPDPDDTGETPQRILRAPLVYQGVSTIGDGITISNDPITLESNKYVVLVLDDPSQSPYDLRLDIVAEGEEGQLDAYEFDPGDDSLVSAKFPLWKVADEASPGSFAVGGFHLTKLCGDGALVVVSHAVLVPDRPVTAFCPRLVSI